MPEALLAIDAGTTSVRVLIVGLAGAVRASTRDPLPIDPLAHGVRSLLCIAGRERLVPGLDAWSWHDIGHYDGRPLGCKQ